MSLLIDALRKAEEQKRRAEPERPPGMRPAADSAPGSDARAARNLFEVKANPRTLSFPVLVALLTTLALVAIGIYFWLQLNPPGPRLVAITPPPELPVLPRVDAVPAPPAESVASPRPPE
ncbi:MAG: hypothetical protein KDG55_22650, partial [Rhodocyclaceae bacterium]|nr:hypothetical protein [Rhodocyclaceae bacterium]